MPKECSAHFVSVSFNRITIVSNLNQIFQQVHISQFINDLSIKLQARVYLEIRIFFYLHAYHLNNFFLEITKKEFKKKSDKPINEFSVKNVFKFVYYQIKTFGLRYEKYDAIYIL